MEEAVQAAWSRRLPPAKASMSSSGRFGIAHQEVTGHSDAFEVDAAPTRDLDEEHRQ